MADITWIQSQPAWVIAFLFATLGVTVSLYNIFMHLRFYNSPQFQLWIVRILIVIPIYGLTSFLALRFMDSALYLETIRDVYEAFVVYCFLKLLLNLMGGEDICVAMIKQTGTLKHPFPFCWFPPLHLDERFLYFCTSCTLQFCIVKPVMAAIRLGVLMAGKDNEWLWTVFEMTIYNISYTLALYALFLFYFSTRESLRTYNPIFKFLGVKMIVFMTYWQSLFVALFPLGDKRDMNGWNNFILCCEMFLFAWLHIKSFPWWEFTKQGLVQSRTGALKTLGGRVLNFTDIGKDMHDHFVASDIKESMNPHKKKLLNTSSDPEKDMDTRSDLQMLGLEDPEIEVDGI